MSTPIVSAIIPTYNRAKYLKNAILSLQQQNLPQEQYEIIVVDQNSTDDTKKVTIELGLSNKAVLYLNEPNLGLHYARHTGARVARGEILAFTDDDAICDPNWLAGLIKLYSEPDVGCVGGRILPKWEVEPPEWISKHYGEYLSLLDWGEQVKELRTPEIYGTNFSIRKTLLFKLGGFNPDSFGPIWLGDGETGLLFKVLKSSHRIIYTPEAVVWHVIPASRLTLRSMKRRFANEGACDSYTLHHETREFRKPWLLSRSAVFGLHAATECLLAMRSRLLKRSEYYYQHILTSSYYASRCLYELRLVFDNKLRELVRREDWIN